MKRIITISALLLSIYLMPWWFTFMFAVVAIFFFDIFVEGVIVALILDWLYAPDFFYFAGYHFAPALALVLCIFVPIVKRSLLI